MLRKLSTTLVLSVAVLAPLPFGSAQAFWGAIWCLLLAGALLIETAPGFASAKIRPAIQLVLLAVVAWCVVVALQYLPVMGLSVGPGWKEAISILGDRSLDAKPAAFAELPIAAVVPPLSLTLALLAGIVFGADEKFSERLFSWVGWSGLVYAAYSVVSALTDPTKLLWLTKTAYVDMLTGTFVNHNTAATYFGCISIIWYVRFLREVRRRIDLTRWNDLGYLFNKFITFERYQLGYAAAAFFLLATTFMTRSRGGSLLTLAALGLVTLLYFASELKDARRVLGGFFVLVVAGTLVVTLAGGRFTSEIENRGVSDVGRLDAWSSSLAIVRDHPWLGTGLGTFPSVFPAYRNPAGGIWGVMDRAHSTPIELLVEMGVPFSVLIFALWSLMLSVLVRASLSAAGNRIYAIAGAGVGVLGTLHSLIDFSLQIPGFSMVCCSLVGAGVATALLPTEQLARTRRASPTKEIYRSSGPQTVVPVRVQNSAQDKSPRPRNVAEAGIRADKPREPATKTEVTEVSDAKVTKAEVTKAKVSDAKVTKAGVTKAKVSDAKVTEVKVKLTKAKVTEVKVAEEGAARDQPSEPVTATKAKHQDNAEDKSS